MKSGDDPRPPGLETIGEGGLHLGDGAGRDPRRPVEGTVVVDNSILALKNIFVLYTVSKLFAVDAIAN